MQDKIDYHAARCKHWTLVRRRALKNIELERRIIEQADKNFWENYEQLVAAIEKKLNK